MTDAITPAHEANRRLARTINLALDLGAPQERGWTLDIGERQLERCARAGFSAIRLVVALALHRDPSEPNQLDLRVLERVTQTIDAARRQGLAVAVANMLDPELMADPPRHRERLLACTHQLAEAIKPQGPDVTLEPLAEPQQALDAMWNDYLADLIAAVRDIDLERTLIAGPRSYNNARFLSELELPRDERNVILTIHHYWPVTFTMQGEKWLGPTEFGDPADWLGNTWDATPQQRAELDAGFAAVAHYARAEQRPIFIGEFGTTNHAEMASRIRWTRFNRQLADRHGFSWGVWSYGPIFALYDDEHDCWHEGLRQALSDAP
jgi:endoglucanase